MTVHLSPKLESTSGKPLAIGWSEGVLRSRMFVSLKNVPHCEDKLCISYWRYEQVVLDHLKVGMDIPQKRNNYVYLSNACTEVASCAGGLLSLTLLLLMMPADV